MTRLAAAHCGLSRVAVVAWLIAAFCVLEGHSVALAQQATERSVYEVTDVSRTLQLSGDAVHRWQDGDR
ncbi:hypothetical protein, partial [Rhodopirellula bahusiensis]